MTGDPTRLGDLEQLVVLAVLHLGEAAYAVSVRDEIERRTSRALARGTVYVTLDRLERKGLLRSAMGAPTPERGGKGRRLFTVEEEGRAALRTSLSELRRMADGIDPELAPGWAG